MLRIISSNDAYFAAAASAAGDEFTTKTTTTTTTINNNNNNILTGSWKKFPNHTYTTPDNKNNKRYYCSTPKSNISKKRCYPSPLDKIRCENYRRRIIDFGLETCSEKSFELNQSFPREKRKRNNHNNNNNNNNNNYYESLTLIEPTNTTTINVKPLKLKYDNNNNKEFIGMDKIRVDGSHGLRFTTRRKGCFTPGNASSSFISGSSIVVNNSTNTTITSTPIAAATAAVSSGVSSTITTTPIVTNINNINNNNKNTAIVRIPKNGINPHKAVFIIDSKTSKILIVNNNACQLLGYTSKELCDLEFSNLLTCKHSNNTHVSALAEVQMNSEDGTMVLLSGKVVEMNTVWNTKIAVSLWIRQIDIAGRCLAVAEPVERIVAEIIIDKNGLILSCDVDALMLFQIESTNHICGNQIQTLIPAIQLPDSDNGSGSSSSHSGKTIIKEIRKQKATGKTADNLTFPLCLMINHNHNHNHNHHQDSTIIMDSNNDSGNVSNIGASGGGGGGNNSSSSNNIDHNNSYVLTIWVYQNISGLMVINELGTIESCNHHFSMLMFGYTQSKIIDRPITDVIPNFGQEFEYVDYIQTNNSHSRNGTSSSLLIDSINNINNINNTNNTNNNNINTSNHNKNIDDSEDATTDPIYNIDCRIACNFSYDDDDDDGDDDGKCSNQENTINYLNNNINGDHPIISQHHHHHHHHHHHRHRRHPQSDGIPFIWKTNSEPDKLASTASTALSKQNNDYENMMINSNTTTIINNNIQCFITKSMSDNSLIVGVDTINNYENNNKNLSNVQNYQNKCNNIKCKINTQSPSSSSSFIDNFKFNLEDEHFIVQNNGTLLIKNHPINLFQHGTRTTINKIPSSSSSSSMVGIAGVGGNDFNELNDIEQLTPVNETADDDNISEYLLRNSLSNKQNNPIDNNNTIELEKLNLYSDDDDDDDDNKRDFGEIKTPTKSEFESLILREQKTPKSEANKTDCCSKSTDNFFNLQRRTSNAIINLPTPPSSSITTITNNNNNNNNNQLQLNLNDGKYKGEAIHHDGNILDILYTISSHILPCGRKVFCVWICRDPDVDDVDDDDDDDDQYLQDDDEKHQNLTLTFNSLTSTVDNSLGQIIKTSAVAATANGTGTGSSSAAAVGAGTSNTIQNSSRPNSVSLMSQCEDDQINGEYGKYYTTLKQIGKGAYGYVKMGYRNSDRLLIITKFILKCKLSPQFMVKTTTATTTTTTDADNNGRGGGGGVGVGEIPMEIYLLTTVKHPNIVAVFDVFENEKFFQMIMERHGSGMDLFEFIDRCRMTWMDEKLGAYIFRQIANAIDYLHTLNILHRDIKDENIIIDQNFHVKLIDFGSATFMEDGRLFSTFYGTTEYCSPEVLAGNKYAGPELEMWSLGVTLYVLMFFENPFLEIEDTLHEELAIPQIISLPLENLLFAMLDKNPKTRCTMKELLKCEWITQEINPLVFNFSMIVQSCAAHELNPEKYFSGQVYSHTTTTTTMTTTGGGVGDGGGGGCCVGGHSTTSPQDSLALADDDDDGDDVDEDSLHVDTNELDDGGLITDNGLLDVIVCHHHHHHHVDDDELGDDDDEDVEEDDEEDDDDDRSQPSQSGCEKYSKLTTTAGDDETVQIDITSNNNNNNSETIINVFKGKQYLPIPNQKSTVMKVTKKDSVILPSSPLLLSSQSSGAGTAETASTSTSITNNNTSISGTDIPNENSIEHSIACNSGYSSSSSPPSTTTTTTTTVFKKHNNYDKMIKSLEDIKKPIITKSNHQNSTIDSKCNNEIMRKTTTTTNRKTIRPNNNGIIKTIPNNGKINDNKTIEEKKTTYELKYNNNIGDKINKNHHQRYDKYNNDDDDEQDNEYDDEEYDDDDEYEDDDEVEEEPDDDLDKESYL